jgi:hypothetical protein
VRILLVLTVEIFFISFPFRLRNLFLAWVTVDLNWWPFIIIIIIVFLDK